MIEKFSKKPKSSLKWQASLKWFKDKEYIELRKLFGSTHVVVAVGKEGVKIKPQWSHAGLTNSNVRISLSGPLEGDWNILNELQEVINEAKNILEIDDPEARKALVILLTNETEN